MSSRYLTLTDTAKVDSSGNATVVLRPSAGEFWALSVVHVATGKTPSNTAFATSSYCAVYQGGLAVQDSTTLLDDTFLGSGDTTTIVSGTIIPFGSSIIAKWKNASNNDVAILTLYGRSYSSLVELQAEMSPVPGARFSGGSGNGMLWEFGANSSAGPQLWSGGNPNFLTPSDCAIEILSAEVSVTTDATAANRFVALRSIGTIVSIPNIHLILCYNGTAQTASSTTQYYWAQGINNYIANGYGTALPSRVIIPPLTTIQTICIASQAGDTWTNFIVSYRRYTSNTKVGYA